MSPYDRVEVVQHAESIVHSLVEFGDGSVKAQLGYPDMKLPIQLALSWPLRLQPTTDPLDLAAVGSLNFSAPNLDRYPCLQLAMRAGLADGTYPAAMAAADEVAVHAFLNRQIRFDHIPQLVEQALDAHDNTDNPSLEAIDAADAWARDVHPRQHRGALVVLVTYVLPFVGVLLALVVLHELGHYVAAKLAGVRVEEFGIGLPPRIGGKQFGETLYSINWLPIGGFVRLTGEESSGVIVERVRRGNSANNSLHPGDRITHVNGKRVNSPHQFAERMAEIVRGTKLEYTISRSQPNGGRKAYVLTLTSLDDSPNLRARHSQPTLQASPCRDARPRPRRPKPHRLLRRHRRRRPGLARRPGPLHPHRHPRRRRRRQRRPADLPLRARRDHPRQHLRRSGRRHHRRPGRPRPARRD